MISGQVVVKGMTYRLDYYEPALVPGKDGDGWESGGSLPIIFSSCEQSQHYVRIAPFIKRFDSPVTAILKQNSNFFSNYFLGGFTSIPSGIGK